LYAGRRISNPKEEGICGIIMYYADWSGNGSSSKSVKKSTYDVSFAKC
jgi:hypothetical protein